MTDKSKSINIIGAGLSGLIAAMLLEQKGFSPIIWEKSDRAGGRLATVHENGFQMDLGFQVLLEAYPKANEHLDYDELELQYLLPGADIYLNGKRIRIGDPIRNPLQFWNVIFSSIGTFKDKWKLLQWFLKLRKSTVEEIFEEEEKTSHEYLLDYGFSKKIINLFFKPFFGGIFLETELTTSSRMLSFVFKMFIQGKAVIPKGGMAEIAKQIEKRLFRTTINYNSKVKQVKDGEIIFENGKEINSDFTIVSSDPSELIKNLSHSPIDWNSCENLYFSTNDRIIKDPIIGLFPGEGLVNNIFFASSIKNDSESKRELLSVTIAKEHSLNQKDLIEVVQNELEDKLGLKDLKFEKHFSIKKALPKIDNMKYKIEESETQILPRVYLTGDYLLNPSQNAAFIAGETVANAILNKT